MLLKAFYDLKQSACLWFNKFADEMEELEFFQSHYDHALYLDHNGTYFAVYVCDLQIVGPDLNLIHRLKTDLVSRFKMTDLGVISHYLAMEVMQNNNTITVTQTVYIDQLLAAHQMSNCNTTTTTMVEGLCLTPSFDNFQPLPTDAKLRECIQSTIAQQKKATLRIIYPVRQ